LAREKRQHRPCRGRTCEAMLARSTTGRYSRAKGTHMAQALQTATANDLRDKIATRTATFGVIGLGYVGLPLATAFAEVGFPVLGFDVSQRTVDGLNSGQSHIKDVPAGTVG